MGAGTALLLQWKRPLHEFARGIDEAELKALGRLVLIALVILPLLPDRAFGPRSRSCAMRSMRATSRVPRICSVRP